MILGWFENLPQNEIPPEHIWEDSEGLEHWWKSVAAARSDGMPTVSGSRDDDDDDAGGDDKPVMVQNDIATFLKKG